MFNKSHREALSRHRQQVEAWAESVPATALRFHSTRDSLRKRILAASGHWWQLFHQGGEVERIDNQMKGLQGVADGLVELLHRRLQLSEEARLLGQQISDLKASEITVRLADRRSQWQVQIDRLGSRCDRVPELLLDQQAMTTLELEVRRHGEVGYWFGQAQEVLEILGADPATAQLQVVLGDLEESLATRGLDEDWPKRLQQLVKPLKDRVDRLRDPPEELQTVAAQLHELRGWSSRLGQELEAVAALEKEHSRLTGQEWFEEKPEPVRELAHTARSLRKKLRAAASESRRRKLEILEQGMLDLSQACGEQPELLKRQENLQQRHQAVRRHQQHDAWKTQFEAALDRFRGVAETKQTELAGRLASRIADLEEFFSKLTEGPLSEGLRHRLESLEHETREIAASRSVEEILAGLRRLVVVEKEVQSLHDEAQQESAQLYRDRDVLATRFADLQEASKRLLIELPVIDTDLEVLAGASWSLEEAQEKIRDLGGHLDEQQRRFEEHCQDLLTAASARIAETRSTLQRAGFSAPEMDENSSGTNVAGGIGSDSSPAAAAARVLLHQARQEALEQSAAQKVEVLQGRREGLNRDLRELALEELPPGDQEIAEQLLFEVEEGSWGVAEDPVERLELLATVAEKADLLLARLRQDRLEAEALGEQLRQRLRRFQEAQLKSYCPELLERVAGLIYGAPGPSRHWPTTARQLKEAQTLFDRAELHAKRLAAREVEEQVESLKRFSKSSGSFGGGSSGRGLGGQDPDRLHRELLSSGHRQLPSVLLRMRLQQALRSGKGGTP